MKFAFLCVLWIPCASASQYRRLQQGGEGCGGDSGGEDRPPRPEPDDGPTGGGGDAAVCSSLANLEATVTGPAAAPLRGIVGCVDLESYGLRDTVAMPIENGQDAFNIYGPMEAGFSSLQPALLCLGDRTVSGGIDTSIAEQMLVELCPSETISALDACGGHAVPYHYHERMQCLYNSDPATGHSTRIGTALDGNGIYGTFIDNGELPTDLDACGGRFGVTPDSNNEVVYYYPVTSIAPFTLGCFGPVDSVEECRALYPDTCGASATIETITTIYGTGQYTLDCPCFDGNESNVIGQGRPGYLPSITGPTIVTLNPNVMPTAAPFNREDSLPTCAPDVLDESSASFSSMRAIVVVFYAVSTVWVLTAI